MVTARRSTDIISSAYEPAVGGVDVLERPRVNEQPTVEQKTNSNNSQLKKTNLDKLLNYDRYAEVVGEPVKQVEEQAVTEPAVKAVAEEDIRPTSTTMQFGDDNGQIIQDLSRGETVAQEGYQLNKKGKIVVMLSVDYFLAFETA